MKEGGREREGGRKGGRKGGREGKRWNTDLSKEDGSQSL